MWEKALVAYKSDGLQVGAAKIVSRKIVISADNKSIYRRAGYFAIVLASINIFGGFLVTQRMLAMYRKKD